MLDSTGIIALMGSGELTSTMVEVHKELLGRYGREAAAVFIDTPAGFQLNVEHLSQRAADYFRSRVGRTLSIASLKSADNASPIELEHTYQDLRKADYILIGPGSPTYALEHWRRTRIPQLLIDHIRVGGCLTAASAAALTLGRFTLPVYEIYKVGLAPYWTDGLNLLQAFGLEDWAVLPHWNNAEGGNHDTRFCFMGQPRLEKLEAQLPQGTGILGLEEHTALIIDASLQEARTRGNGRVILRRRGHGRVFGPNERIPLELLRHESAWAGRPDPIPSAPPEPAPLDGLIPSDEVWDPLAGWASQIQELIDGGRIEEAAALLMKLEKHLWDHHEALLERNALGAAREIMREMLALIVSSSARRPAGTRECLAPLVEQVLALRTRLREQKQWAAADQLRDGLRQAGVVVADTAQGQIWELNK